MNEPFEGLKLRACRQPFIDVIQLMMLREDHSGSYVGEPVKMRRLTEEEQMHSRMPTASIKMEAAQLLMDDLWQCGLRPSEGTGSAGALMATQKHLDDMRKLTFDMTGTLIKQIEL